ncbi:PEP-utilizing enzyme [Mycobacterium sp. MYCO198283]|uniref:PEP-utilizing enzyme n=1 Tax=Mycobacterium sp. MYCO198283 TaxID=2883505 RepID=UPI001E3797D3|nr:PEP-utilizing enzyme [Mycobacterium sp. MYCO198283]MCG5433965.1 PEP-utilizing enzyme [Mycobacterium sp. MYCO198283]
MTGRAGQPIVVSGVDTPVGRAVADRLVAAGHRVVGVAPRRPVGWPGALGYVRSGEPLPPGAATVVSCGAHVEIRAAAESPPRVVLRYGLVLGRDVDDDVLAAFTAPVVRSRAADRPLPVVHPHDVAAYAVRCVADPELTGRFELSAGHTTVRAIATATGRPVVPGPDRPASTVRGGERVEPAPGFGPAWSAAGCVADFALTARGRISLRGRIFALPWRLARVRDVRAVDTPASDGVAPVVAGPPEVAGEFDTPIDPRFPAFVATNLSEALPGPFTPSSASVSVRGTRAAGMVIAERLRPGGVVQQEMATRTTGVFGHRLYAGMTSAVFMAGTVPFVRPELITDAFFGRTARNVDVFGADLPAPQRTGVARQLRSLAVFGVNLVGLSLGSRRETRDYVADVAALEAQAQPAASLDDTRLHALILAARDAVVAGWVVSSASILVCTAYGVVLRVLCGRDTVPFAGREVVSAQSLGAVHRLAGLARGDDAVMRVLRRPDCADRTRGGHLADLADAAPEFHRRLLAELTVIGHRGPAEVEMSSPSYADRPDRLVRAVAKAAVLPAADPAAASAGIPAWVRPVAAVAAAQLRDREVRRDRMVRAIWVLRGLLRDAGARLAGAGILAQAEDIFFLQVDEVVALPGDVAGLVARRRAEQRRLADVRLPEAFSGHWEPTPAPAAALEAGDRMQGTGVCGGRVRGRVRVVTADTVDDLQPGEVLVARVTDVGYTPAFAYAAAVLTELGGPISHAAIVAREFGVTCVVNARDATTRLPDGALVEVDGATGEVEVLDLAAR